MARYEYKELNDNLYVHWTSKNKAAPFQLINSVNEQTPTEINLTPEEARDLALFLVQHLYEYI